jgi:hypothetical protein
MIFSESCDTLLSIMLPLRMSDMRPTRLLHGAGRDHNDSTLSIRVAHLSPSSSGAETQ